MDSSSAWPTLQILFGHLIARIIWISENSFKTAARKIAAPLFKATAN
jgi:hypothetical protein